MPLIKVDEVSPGVVFGLWEISEELDVLLQDNAFNNLENVNIDLLHPKKQMEYTTSRILIARLCEQIGVDYSGIIKDEHGKPHLNGSNYQLSLSHSFPYAVAILNKDRPAGIDIEYPSDKIKRISSKFLNEAELQYREEVTDLCKVWCIKETLYKIYGRRKVDYKKHLHVKLGPAPDEARGLFANDSYREEFQIKIGSHDGFIYCYNL